MKTKEDIYNDLAAQNAAPVEEEVKDPVQETENTASEQTEEVVEDTVTEVTEEASDEDSTEIVNEEETVSSTDQVTDNDDDDDIFDSWDDSKLDESTTETEEPLTFTTSEPNYNDLGKELGIEAESKEELVTKVKELVQEAKQEPDYSELPERLQTAIKMAKQGDDFERLFDAPEGMINHSTYDDETLLINEYSHYFKDEAGNVDKTALEDYIEAMDDVQKKVQSKQIRTTIDNYNANLQAQRDLEQKAQRNKADTELKSALSGLDDVKGFKVSPSHKKDMYEKISTGEAAKEMFYKDDGSYDMNKLSEIYFIYNNFDKIKNFLVGRTRNQVKKEDFESISNANVKGREMQTEVHNNEQKSGMDLMLEDLAKRNEAQYFNAEN